MKGAASLCFHYFWFFFLWKSPFFPLLILIARNLQFFSSTNLAFATFYMKKEVQQRALGYYLWAVSTFWTERLFTECAVLFLLMLAFSTKYSYGAFIITQTTFPYRSQSSSIKRSHLIIRRAPSKHVLLLLLLTVLATRMLPLANFDHDLAFTSSVRCLKPSQPHPSQPLQGQLHQPDPHRHPAPWKPHLPLYIWWILRFGLHLVRLYMNGNF